MQAIELVRMFGVKHDTAYRSACDLADEHDKSDTATDRAFRACVEALEALDSVLDFDHPAEPGDMGIVNPSALNAAMDRARAALALAQGVGEDS